MPKKDRSKARVKHTVKVGGKWFALQTTKPFQPAPRSFFPEMHEIEMTTTVPQIRHLARGSAVLLAQKILAGDPQGHQTVLQFSELTNLRFPKAYAGFQDRSPLDFDKEQEKKLDPEYVERKVREGGDPRPLIDTGFYVKHLEVKETRLKSRTQIVVRVPNVIHRPSGVRLPTLAGWLEYGNSRIKARPHWRPVAVQVRNKWRRLPKDIRVEALREALRKMR